VCVESGAIVGDAVIGDAVAGDAVAGEGEATGGEARGGGLGAKRVGMRLGLACVLVLLRKEVWGISTVSRLLSLLSCGSEWCLCMLLTVPKPFVLAGPTPGPGEGTVLVLKRLIPVGFNLGAEVAMVVAIVVRRGVLRLAGAIFVLLDSGIGTGGEFGGRVSSSEFE
jgi:hypothetical protein